MCTHVLCHMYPYDRKDGQPHSRDAEAEFAAAARVACDLDVLAHAAVARPRLLTELLHDSMPGSAC